MEGQNDSRREEPTIKETAAGLRKWGPGETAYVDSSNYGQTANYERHQKDCTIDEFLPQDIGEDGMLKKEPHVSLLKMQIPHDLRPKKEMMM